VACLDACGRCGPQSAGRDASAARGLESSLPARRERRRDPLSPQPVKQNLDRKLPEPNGPVKGGESPRVSSERLRGLQCRRSPVDGQIQIPSFGTVMPEFPAGMHAHSSESLNPGFMRLSGPGSVVCVKFCKFDQGIQVVILCLLASVKQETEPWRAAENGSSRDSSEAARNGGLVRLPDRASAFCVP
jgi:hypothetical protein